MFSNLEFGYLRYARACMRVKFESVLQFWFALAQKEIVMEFHQSKLL